MREIGGVWRKMGSFGTGSFRDGRKLAPNANVQTPEDGQLPRSKIHAVKCNLRGSKNTEKSKVENLKAETKNRNTGF